MKRLTTNVRLALERLAEHGGITVEKVSGGYSLWGHGNRIGGSSPMSAKVCLARLVLTAQWNVGSGGWDLSQEQVRDVIRLTSITSHGLVAHQEQTIREVLT